MADSGELTEEALQERLNAYQQALQEEYEAQIAETPDPASVAENTRVFLRSNGPLAAAQIAWLAGNSSSDSVRLAASKYIIDHILEDHEATGDPIKDLLNSLSGTKTKPPV